MTATRCRVLARGAAWGRRTSMPLLFFLGRSFASRLPHHSPHPTANTAYRLVAARVWKSPWLVTLLEAYGGRLAIEATVEPPATNSRNQQVKIPDERAGFYRAEGWGPRGVPHM